MTTVILESDFSTILGRVASLDLSRVEARLRQEKTLPPETVAAAVDEYRKFLALAAVERKPLGMLSTWVDEVWHAHLLFTRQYARDCAAVIGHFLHHTPALPEAPVASEDERRFRRAYRERFGALHSLWSSTVATGTCGSGGDGSGGSYCGSDGGCTSSGGGNCSGDGY